MPDTIIETILTVLGAIAVAYLSFRGIKHQARAAKDANRETLNASETDAALQAWKDLVTPYKDEVAQLREELSTERAERLKKQRADDIEREAAKRVVQEQMDSLTKRIDLLNVQLTEWKRLARTIARWAATLRDEVLRLGGTVPATPDELLTLRAIEDAQDDR